MFVLSQQNYVKAKDFTFQLKKISWLRKITLLFRHEKWCPFKINCMNPVLYCFLILLSTFVPILVLAKFWLWISYNLPLFRIYCKAERPFLCWRPRLVISFKFCLVRQNLYCFLSLMKDQVWKRQMFKIFDTLYWTHCLISNSHYFCFFMFLSIHKTIITIDFNRDICRRSFTFLFHYKFLNRKSE